MTKCSTNWDGGDGDGNSCELCGRSTVKLRHASVAGADLLVCPDHAPHGENRHADRKSESSDTSRDDSSGNRKKRAAQRTAKLHDGAKGDLKYWEEKRTSHKRDRLPYLVSGYGGVIESARQNAGLQPTEFTDELDFDKERLLAIEQDRITRANVGGSAIHAPEKHLDVTLVDE